MITVEEILEYLNSNRIEDMTEEMHECSMRQSQAAIKQTMELNTKYHTPEETFTSEKMYSSIPDAASRIRVVSILVIIP
ncbi:hypothetical protein [Butyrivibrio sp. INlla16]|uniref:hypothetical protein n=1 Tax=Butyrivibrio sp. INlla16 TaxID=1520807 RepID=UPI002E8E13D0|nr:hypothetical protein [Butyrivibrio sp. INlla16]